jgi:hypothetical protein
VPLRVNMPALSITDSDPGAQIAESVPGTADIDPLATRTVEQPPRPRDGDSVLRDDHVRDDHVRDDDQYDSAADASADAPSGREPKLTVPEHLTPLPAIDRALPTIRNVGSIVRGKYGRYRVAVFTTLQADSSWRWKIGRIREIVHWLEPTSTTEIVADLKDAGYLEYDGVTRLYRFGEQGRFVAAVLGVLSVPNVERRVMIRVISKSMAMALAAGAGDDVVMGQFRSAVAQLQQDWDELNELIEDGSREALLVAAHLGQGHAQDMQGLLDEHESFLASRKQGALHLDLEQEALELIFAVTELTAHVTQAITATADELMRAGFHVDRGDIRQFLLDTDEDTLAALVAGLAVAPPFVVGLDTAGAFDALLEMLGRTRPQPPPLPEPVRLERRELPPPPEKGHDRIAAEAAALTETTPLVEFVVQESWAVSIARHTDLIDAHSRYPADMPTLEHDEPRSYDTPKHDGVWRITRVDLKPQKENGDENP